MKYYNIITNFIETDKNKFSLYKDMIDAILTENADERARALAIDEEAYKLYYRKYYQSR